MTTPRPTRATATTAPSHDGRPMKYDHGQRAAYCLDRCRCDECRDANTIMQQADRNRIAPTTVDADQAREHLATLSAAGVGLKTVARRSGVSHGALSKLVHGTATTAPSKRIRATTMAKILAVTPADAAAGARVDAAPLWALIDDMVAAGVPRRRIAEQLGQKGPELQLGPQTMTAAHSRRIREIHAGWIAGEITLARRSRHGDTTITAPLRPAARIYRSEILIPLAELLEASNDQPWRRDAACRGFNPEIWHPAPADTRTAAAAVKICRGCTARPQCLAAHLDQPDGIWGGLTPAERAGLRAAA